MWWGSGSDPSGSASEGSSKEQPPQNQQLSDLQEQFKQQQLFIAQLKEMLKKTEQTSSVSREKVEEYASTLSEMNARAKRSRLKKSENKRNDPEESSVNPELANKKSAVSTPANEKVNLLRQQLEESKIKVAQRDKNQKGIEEMVNQLKAQLNTSQGIFNQSKLNIAPADNKSPSYSTESSKEDLLAILSRKDEHILELTAKVQGLQANVLDLQENVKEKDSVIDARTKAITLLSENLSKKGKNTLDMLDETKEQMRKMQENFVVLESNMKHENIKLQSELSKKAEKLQNLLENNGVLNNKCSELETIKTNLEKKLAAAQQELESCKLETKASECKVEELSNRLSAIENTSSSITSTEKTEKTKGKPGKKSKLKEETTPIGVETYLARITELEKNIEELKYKNSETIQAEQQKQVTKPESSSTENEEILKLNKQLEDMNKNMIKLKAQHKSRLKEIQKKMNSGELIEKISNLEQENSKLLQAIAELEEEKGNLQLRLVEYESNKDKDYISDLENKIEEQKMEIENHIRSITSLESEITAKSNEISSLRSELSSLMHLENAQVCSEMTSVQLEEQLDKEVSQKKQIQDKYNGILKENESLLEKIDALGKEKQELTLKLENYMQENMDLIDRLEKLSAEKVSSAESIEIVESLTQQEKLEIEAYQKNLEFSSDKPSNESSELEQSPEFTESVTKLSDEASELMERIELFTAERHEVMDKMDSLSTENHQLITKLEKNETEKLELEKKYNNLLNENEELTTQLQNLIHENKKLSEGIEEIIRERNLENEVVVRENLELKKVVEQCQLLVEEQKQEIVKFQEELLRRVGIEEEKSAIESNLLVLVSEKQTLEELNSSLTNQLSSLQHKHDLVRKENQDTKRENSELNEVKHNMEGMLNISRNNINELQTQIEQKFEEITSLQSYIENNKNELSQCSELQNELSETISELNTAKNEIIELQKIASDLNYQLDQKDEINEDNNKTISNLSAQLTELKDIVNENFGQLENYETEMKQNSTTIDDLIDKLEELKYKILETEHMIEVKDIEINQLRTEKSTNEMKITNLEKELKNKDNYFGDLCRQLRGKCEFLEKQIKMNTGSIEDIRSPFEAKINELELRNKEQVEKMKKIAANLKKKVNVCQELENKLKDVTEKWETESREKTEYKTQLDESNKKVESLSNQLQEIDGALCTLQINFAAINEECQLLTSNYNEKTAKVKSLNEALNNKINEFENILEENSKLKVEILQQNDINNNLQMVIEENQKEISNLNIQIDTMKVTMEAIKEQSVRELLNKIDVMKADYETSQNALEAKIQEKDMFIESVEAENNKYKERIFKLEDGLSTIEERREMLEQKTLDLKTELEAQATACEEAFQTEDILEQRLTALMTHDDLIEKKLKQTVLENQTLNNKVASLLKENGDLTDKITKTETKLKHNEHNDEKIDYLENEISRLLQAITKLENELKKIHLEYQTTISQKRIEIENLEIDLNSQLQELTIERKNLHIQCEILEENLKEYVNNEQLLNEEIDQLKDKLSNLKRDLDTQLTENETLSEVNSKYLLKIQNYESDETDKSTNKNEEESIKTELQKLQQVIAQKDIDIQNYQRQNMQLQMASFGAPPQATSFALPFETNNQTEIIQLNNVLAENTTRFNALETQINNVTQQLFATQSELQCAQNKVGELNENNQQLLTQLEEQQQITQTLQRDLLSQQELLIRRTAETGVHEIISTAEKTISDFGITDAIITDLEEKVKEITAERDSLNEKLGQEIIHEEISKKHQQQDSSESPKRNERVRDIKKEDLLEKIKALEFMLYNVEKEKDDALVQCHGLLNELTRLIYEREKYLKEETHRKPVRTEIDMSSMEEEIIQEDSSNITQKDLHSLEYFPTEVKISKELSLQPIEESLIQQKSAYLCYDVDKPTSSSKYDSHSLEEASGWGAEDNLIKESIESEIIASDAVPMSAEEKHQLQLLEFEHVRMPKNVSLAKPITERVQSPRSAYLCYPDDCKGILSEDTFASEEDGWGWTTEEAKLEEAHIQSLSVGLPSSESSSRVQQLQEKIEDLELERTRLLEEIKTSQVRSGKLIKKLKDMKLKNNALVAELNKKSSGDCYDLDMAIQDELNTQIKSLEKTVKELTDELNKDKFEKENLLKRNEVLNAANERMIELKEKQDNELQFIQFKNRELSSKLELLEWGDDSDEKTPKKSIDPSNANADELNKNIQELIATVNDLTLDNEEMQSMLEEQRTLRIDAEKALVPIRENIKSEEDFLKLQKEKQVVDEELNKLKEEKKSLEENISVYIKTNEDLISQTTALQSNIEYLLQEKELANTESLRITNELQIDKENLQNQISKLNLEMNSHANTQIEIEQLKIHLSSLEADKHNLQILLNEKEIACQNLDSYLRQLEAAKSALESKLEEILNMQNTNNGNEEKIKELNETLTATLTDLDKKNTEINELNNLLLTEREQFQQKLLTRTEELAQEWLFKVDERGNDVAESWILHVESRENEFTQLEQNLRFELNELDRKHESIVQENGELQKKIELLTTTNINSSNNELEAIQQLLKDKEIEVVKLSEQLQSLNAILDNKNSEIVLLTKSLDASHLKDIELNKLKTQIIVKEEHYEELLSTKDADLENLRVQLNEQERRLTKEETDKRNLKIHLDKKMSECTEFERKIVGLSNFISEIELSVRSSASFKAEINNLTGKLENEESNRLNLQTQLDTSLRNNAELKLENSSMQIALSNEEKTRHLLQIQCTELESKIAELNQLSQEESSQIQELKDIIESQVLKIEELKQQLYEKSNEYDALLAEIETFQHEQKEIDISPPEKHVHFQDFPDEENQQDTSSQDVDNLAEPVSRAELDLALYMLHQRDVRCEELTVELMQLLEERDTLQLKLSNAIRVNEDLKTKRTPEKSPDSELKLRDSPKIVRSTGAIPKSKSTAIVLGATGTELATEATENIADVLPETADNIELADKLSQLRSIGYRDKTLKDDQEIRHIQQMTVMQQHRDLASRLPPEAAARLVDASYTLSRDVQSPSKVLLNWLWGRSTPKVNDI